MNQENSIMQAITGKAALSDTNVEQWEALLNQYPAFGTGHLLFAKRLMQEKSTASATIQQKAAIHFNDLHWLDYLLKGPATPINNQVEIPKPIEVPEPEPEPEPIDPPPTHPVPDPKQGADSGDVTDNQPVIDKSEEASLSETSMPATESLTTTSDLTEMAAATTAAPLLSQDTQQRQEDSEEHPRLSSILSAQLADFQKPVDQTAALPSDAEPLYRTDYFASQGILQVKTQDELGKKVKRFTDWLKDMKKNDTGGSPVLETTEQEEAQIIHKAAVSLKTEVVLTESMAEVLLQQGKTDQAKSVYHKLSLLYPEKSSYFASKIDSLL